MRILAAAAAFCISGLALAPGARAEDFSGFYAGVNAGYGFGKNRTESYAGPVTTQAPTGADTALPPSAASAARTMQGTKSAPAKAR